MAIMRCPDCGKVISSEFPLHDCKPTPNFKRYKASLKKTKKPRGPQVGDRVWWTDPDGGTCSGAGKLIKINGDVYSVTKDDGGEVECPRAELKKIKELKKFSVDIQHVEEFTYQVEAPTRLDAERLARARYESGDDEGEHTEIVGDAIITNSEEI